jgi:hypothetical protein
MVCRSDGAARYHARRWRDFVGGPSRRHDWSSSWASTGNAAGVDRRRGRPRRACTHSICDASGHESRRRSCPDHGGVPARERIVPQDTIASVFAIASPEAKPVRVQVASAAPSSSSIGGFFGNLFGSKHDNTNSNVRESSVTQPVQTKSQAAPTAPSAAPAQTKATATAQRAPEAQRTTDSKKLANTKPQASPPQQDPSPPDAGGARTTNVLIGAVPTVPAGGFQNRFGAGVKPGD